MSHQHHTAPRDGATIAWSSRGSGDPVVLVHGITESAASFDPVSDRLSTTHRVISLDLRGHGESSGADSYDLGAMAGDVTAVIAAAGAERPHLVGHSLGGAVVTAVGATLDVASVVDIDQSLQLDGFKALLAPVEPLIRDPDQYRVFVDAMFDSMWGERISVAERTRVNAARGVDHDVVLGVWELILTQPVDDIAATVDAVLAGYSGRSVPYLALFGIDPAAGYAEWLSARIPSAAVECWDGYGHYPHLVDPDRFVGRLRDLWAT